MRKKWRTDAEREAAKKAYQHQYYLRKKQALKELFWAGRLDGVLKPNDVFSETTERYRQR